MSRATIPAEAAKQLGLDRKEPGTWCELFVESIGTDGSVVVTSDYLPPGPGEMRGKPSSATPENHFSKALRKY